VGSILLITILLVSFFIDILFYAQKTRLVAGYGKETNCLFFYAKSVPATNVWGVWWTADKHM